MWEYRVSWIANKPGWWDAAWQKELDQLTAAGLAPEQRDDRYWMLAGRSDVGLKLRGTQDGEFEVKVLYEGINGWELWEKVVFRTWSPLEAVRFSVLLGAKPDFTGATKIAVEGAKRVLRDVDVAPQLRTVSKKRLQSTAGSLFGGIPEISADGSWLAELAELQITDRGGSIWSVCFETVRRQVTAVNIRTPDGLCCGYPQLLETLSLRA